MKLDYKYYKKKFEKDGYIILSFFKIHELGNLKKFLAKAINNSYKKYDLKIYHNVKDLDETLNKGMINLEKIDHSYLSEIYDMISKSTLFYSLLSNKNLLVLIKHLLNLKNNHDNLLINSNTLRMDTPGISKFTYGWHKDENTNIPNSHFVQLWFAPFNDVNSKNGALEIALNSHLIDTKTNKTHNERKKLGKINRTSFLKTKILNDKFKKKFINLRVGEILIFKNTLVHRSGLSEKNKMRYAAVSFYHDINSQDFIYKKIDQK